MKIICRSIFIIYFICGICLNTLGQEYYLEVDKLMKLKPIGIPFMDRNRLDTTMVALEMPFAKAHWLNQNDLKNIKLDQVISVQLFYTKYRELDTFNQPELNRDRYEQLKKDMPQLFANNKIQWVIYEQRAPKNKQEASKCFHGFVIIQPKPISTNILKEEIAKIETLLKTVRDTVVFIPEKIDFRVKKRRVETGKYLPRSRKKERIGYRYNKKSIWNREPETRVIRDTIIKHKTGGYSASVKVFDSSLINHPYIFRTLMNRDWGSNIAVVQDVTGSMTPYSMQIMLWLKMKPEILNAGKFLFFNDGDNEFDALKKIGRIGGLYLVESNIFDTICNTLYMAMFNGQGGDVPENNIEALIKAQETFANVDTLIMIADNAAPVKDIELLKKVKKPVHIVLCGVNENIHKHYIDIARTTGGSLFILGEEFKDVKKLKEGGRYEFGFKKFLYSKGQLIAIGHAKN